MIQRRVPDSALYYVIWTGIALILLTPFIVSPQTVFPFVVGKALYSRSLIEIVCVAWALLALFRPSYRPPRSRLLILLAIALGVAALAACLGVGVQRSLWSTYERMQGVVDQAHWLALAVVLVSVVRTAKDWRILLILNLVAAVTIALLAIGQHTGLDDARAIATLGNPIFLGTYLQVNVTIALGFLARSLIPAAGPSIASSIAPPSAKKRRKRRGRTNPTRQPRRSYLSMRWLGGCFWGAATLLSLWALTLSASRGAFLGLVVSLAFLAVLSLFLARARVVRVVAAGSVGLLGIAAILLLASLFTPYAVYDAPVSNPLVARLADFKAQNTVRTRLAAWEAGARGFVEHPALGWGPENYIVVSGRYGTGLGAEMEVHDHAHSKLVEELATKGLSGLLSHLAIWVFAFHIVVRAVRAMDPGERVPVLFVGAALMGYFVQSLTSPDTAVGSLQLTLLLAFVANLEAVRTDLAPAARQETRVQSPISPPPGMLGRLAERHGVRVLLAVGITILVGIGLLANHAAYSAAGATVRAIRSMEDPASPPGQTRAYFEQAIADFKPLANFPRFALFHHVAERWRVLRARHRVEAARLLALVNVEAAVAVESEPENWRIHVALARLYAVIRITDPEYRDTARRYLDRSLELAPDRKEVLSLTAGFDVSIEENELLYVKDPCAPADTKARFFLHVTPLDTNDLPKHRKQYGFDNLDFAFDSRGVILDGQCRVTVSLPEYAITRIRTGQFISGQGQVWRKEFFFGK